MSTSAAEAQFGADHADAGQITANNTAQHNAAEHARAQREEVVAIAGKFHVCFLNDKLMSDEVGDSAGKMNVGYPNVLLKSMEVMAPRSRSTQALSATLLPNLGVWPHQALQL